MRKSFKIFSRQKKFYGTFQKSNFFEIKPNHNPNPLKKTNKLHSKENGEQEEIIPMKYRVFKLPQNLKILERNCEEYIKEENIEEIKETILTISKLKNLEEREKKLFQVISVKMIQILKKQNDKKLMLNIFHEFEKQKFVKTKKKKNLNLNLNQIRFQVGIVTIY